MNKKWKTFSNLTGKAHAVIHDSASNIVASVSYVEDVKYSN